VAAPNPEHQRIADMLSDVVEEAMRQQQSSKQALAELNKAGIEVKSITASARNVIHSAARELPLQIENAIDKKLKDAAKEAANTMTAQWDQANLAAERAAGLYSLSRDKMLAVAGIVFVAGLVVGTGLTAFVLRGC
jgi:uncharacterized membrane protein YheB (UPF0754 family)